MIFLSMERDYNAEVHVMSKTDYFGPESSPRMREIVNVYESEGSLLPVTEHTF